METLKRRSFFAALAAPLLAPLRKLLPKPALEYAGPKHIGPMLGSYEYAYRFVWSGFKASSNFGPFSGGKSIQSPFTYSVGKEASS